jgi:hypothetical protein
MRASYRDCALDPAAGYLDCTYQLHIFKIYVLNNSRTINTNACGKLRVLLSFSRQHIFHKVGRNFVATLPSSGRPPLFWDRVMAYCSTG